MPLPGDQHRDTPATTNPFLPAQPPPTSYTAREIATLQSRLDRQLGPEYISTRPGAGGGKVHYLAAEKVINLANEVFGFNGWSSAIQNVQIDFVDENSTNGKITLGLSTIVRVTVRDGTFHEDIGYGHIENCKGKAAAFEKAKKEAATDALKRALRNFGNVLGNCLYDKEYLQKVTKVKVAPSKWDAGNLHRHPDYAPVKRESLAEAEMAREREREERSAATAAAAATRRQSSAQSGTSFGSADFEEDFGGAMLNEDDFTHPDEVHLDDTSMMSALESPAQRAVNGPQGQANANGVQRQGGVQRMHSMPHLRPPNAQTSAPAPGAQAPQRPQAAQRPTNNSGPSPAAGRMPPPPPQNGAPRGAPQAQQTGSSHRPPPPHHQGPPPNQPPQQRPPPPAQHHHQPQPQPQDPSRSNPSSNTSSTSTTNPDPTSTNPTPLIQNPDGATLDPTSLPLPRAPPPDAPQGFITGRGVDLLKAAGGGGAPGARDRLDQDRVRFDPAKESPSIRRTVGVNPGVSRKVRRSEVGGGGGAAQGQGAGAGAGSGGGGGTGAAAPPPPVPTTPLRTNYVNPAADPHRRIGAPLAGGGGGPNRGGGGGGGGGAYRPPTTNHASVVAGVKRPALADVSNTANRGHGHGGGEGGLPQVDGAGEEGVVKRARVEGEKAEAVYGEGVGVRDGKTGEQGGEQRAQEDGGGGEVAAAAAAAA